MENNNENQKSTEQLYSNIEESSITIEQNVEEDTSYSLEDLHPEDVEKVVVPAASHAEEVQPDPTVIDGKRETIGDQSSIMEVQQINQNVQQIQPQPSNGVQMVIPQQPPVQQVPIQKVPTMQKNTIQKQAPEEPNAKVFYVIFAIILLGVFVGLPLYTSIQNSLESKTGTSEPINKTEEPQPQDNQQSNQPTPQTPQLNQITFNMELKFDNGFVTNEKEVNQKEGYLPTNLNGVIRCDLENPIIQNGITTYKSTYLHYENFKLRSAITISRQVYADPGTYINTKDATLVYKNAGDKEETLDVEIKQDDTTYTVSNIMQYHLMYGHSTYVEEIDTYLMFPSPYNTNIKAAIDSVIKNAINDGSTVCGTINTDNATS